MPGSLIVEFNQDYETTGAFNHVKGDDEIKELRLWSGLGHKFELPKHFFPPIFFSSYRRRRATEIASHSS